MNLFECDNGMLERCQKIIDEYYFKIREELFKENYAPAMYIMNHICRICLQMNDSEAVEKCFDYIIKNQLPNGGWGDIVKGQSIYGITATELQLLIWGKEKKHGLIFKDDIERAINEGYKNLLKKSGHEVYWVEKESTDRVHGLLDLNHYIAQCLYYTKYTGYEKQEDAKAMLELLYLWYKEMQAVDGGWHEVGKERYREGTTSDAIRALLPNVNNKKYIQKGIDYLVNNQNPVNGYWSGGNHDKCYDVLKTIINSLWIIDRRKEYIESIVLGIKYILSFDLESMELEEQCDFLAVIIDAVNIKDDLYVEKIFF